MTCELLALANGSHFYRQVRESSHPFFEQRRKKIERMWGQFRPYAEGEFVDRFPHNIPQRYWEMAVGCHLLDSGFHLSKQWAARSGGDGLDFRVEDFHNRSLWIECTTCGTGNWNDEKVDPRNLVPTAENYEDHLARADESDPKSPYLMQTHFRQIKLRVASKFADKIKHIEQRIANPTDPSAQDDYFIIAIGGGEIESRIWHDTLINDLAVVSLFAPIVDTNSFDLDDPKPILRHECSIDKAGARGEITKPLEMPGSKLVSGVLFSSETIASLSYQWEDPIFAIENYNAQHVLPENMFGPPFRQIRMRRHDDRLVIQT